jgi:hypothetical protein
MVQYFPEITGSLKINGSLSVSGPMSITGSIAGTSSLASNALLLDGTGSVGFTTTGSFTATSSSLSSRTTQIESVYATTGSNSFRATQSITGSLTVTGQIIAQTLNVQQVTSSIVYSSGSNTFGCDINSRQTFTGSFYQTGSVAVFSNNLGIGVSQPSSPLSIGGTFNGNTPLICITGTGTGVYQRVIAAINPGMNPGDDLTIQMGTALNSKNVGQLNYHHEGAGCATNRMSIGLYGVDDVLNVTGNGFVGIGTCTPTVKLDILGNNEVMNIAGCNSISAYTGYYYNTSTLVGYIGNGSSILSGAASSDFIFRSQGALVYATCGNNERMRITGAGDLQFKNTSTSAQFIYGGSNSGYLLIGGGEGSSLNCGANIVLVGNDRNGTNTRGEISLQAGGTSSGGFINLLTCGTERMRVTSAGPTIFSNNVCINGAGYGLQFTGGNNRIYFGACRAIEGSTSGTTLQIGENYDKTQIQSSAMMYNGSGGNSPKLYFGGEGNETAGAKAIYLETYWMIIQPHVNEGLRFRAVNASGTQYTIAKMYGTGTFSLDQYSNGTLSVSGGVVVSSSDKCMKIDDGGINIALPKIMCLNPRYFYWKSETCLNSCDRQLGFYAQDVSEVLGTEVANQSHNCSWGIYDRGIIAMLTKGMQEQQCTICSQAAIINTLKTCIGIA